MAALSHFLLWRLRFAQATTETTRAERDALARHASGKTRLVEIGVAQGVTTRRLRAAMAPDAELWAVDPYFPNRLGIRFSEAIAQGEVSTVENGHVRWVRSTGVDAAALWRKEGRPPADFIFIDGDHRWAGIAADWEHWSELVGPGGVIGLHDSRSTPEHPLRADSVRYTAEVVLRDARFRLVTEVDSLTVVERI